MLANNIYFCIINPIFRTFEFKFEIGFQLGLNMKLFKNLYVTINFSTLVTRERQIRSIYMHI